MRVCRAAVLTTAAAVVSCGLAGCGGQPADPAMVSPRAADIGASPSAAAVPGVAPLEVTVGTDRPTVRVGEQVRFTVSWTDGDGIFAGTTEDFGEGVGAGSTKIGACESASTMTPSEGRYELSHTWTVPGTYHVRIGVSTSSCVGGPETAEKDLAVLVVR
jgi:hypothetical protein